MTRIVITGCDYQMRDLIMNDKLKKNINTKSKNKYKCKIQI